VPPEFTDLCLFVLLLILFIYVLAVNRITFIHKVYLAFHFLMMLWPACQFFINIVPEPGYQWLFLNIAFVGLCYLGYGWLIFALVLTKKWDGMNKSSVYFLSLPAVASSILVTTNPWHFMFAQPQYGDWMVRSYGPYFWFLVISNSFYLVLATTMMLRTMQVSPGTNVKKQMFLCFWGLILLLGFSLADVLLNVVIPVFGIIPGLTSFGIIVSAVCYITAIQKYNLFNIVTIARQEVIDSMATGIIVLDRYDVVLGVNASTNKFVGIRPGQIFDIENIFLFSRLSEKNSDFLEEFIKYKSKNLQAEITLMGDDIWHISINVSPLLDNKKNLLGRVISLNDVTELRRLVDKINEKNLALRRQNKELLRVQDELFEANSKLEQLSVTDELTGCYNRRYLLQQLLYEIAMTQRYKTPFSLLLFDLDSFKLINDTYGHLVGDDVLRAVVNAVTGSLRRTDILARYGGEEFIVYTPHTDSKNAEILAEKIRSAVQARAASVSGINLQATISIGLVSADAGLEESQTPESLLNKLLSMADGALYQAKARGRNCVAAAGDFNRGGP
jgi:diguanylate cyclase (GGDEF)-like protein